MPRAKSPTQPSTPRLSEVARHVVIPAGIVTTAWPRVVAKCRELAVEFDGWQHGIGAIILGKRADGSFAATVGGIVLSIPRQVGKTFLVGMIVVAMCLLFPGLTVVWTAHRSRTATKTFHTLKAMTSRPRIAPHMLEPRTTNGEQEIRFRNKSVIMFGAREQGFGRGFDEVDIAVFDEAQILTEKGVEDIVPATNQSKLDGGALLFFMGTPPRPADPGEEFTNRRTAALEGRTEDTVYVEFSADDEADLDDQKQWAKANPSFPSRTPLASMKRMRANLTDDDSFRREALGIWGTFGGGLFGSVRWARRQDAASVPSSRIYLAIHVTPDRAWSAVGVASPRTDGRMHVELIAHQPGTSWVVPYLTARLAKRTFHRIVIAGSMAAGTMAAEFENMPNFEPLNATEVRRACGGFYDLVAGEGLLAVRPHPDLDDAIDVVRKSSKTGEWVFSADPGVDVASVYAVALAAHAARLDGDVDYDVAASLY